MLNQITLMGRLTKEPELRFTSSQKPVASFTIACDRDFGGRDGQEKQTDFISCVAWNATAEFVSKYFRKGSMAVLSGRLQIREWTDKDGGKHRTAEVVTENIYFGEKKTEDRGNDAAGKAAETKPGEEPQSGGFLETDNEDGGVLPF